MRRNAWSARWGCPLMDPAVDPCRDLRSGQRGPGEVSPGLRDRTQGERK